MASAAFWADAPAQQTSGSDELSEIVVNSLRATTTVAKQDVEIRDLPQAITIVPSTLLDEGEVRRVEDIAFNTVGITPSAVFGGAVSDGGFSRGFTQNLLVDGYTLGAGFPIPLELVDRAEILRGSTSVLYGQGSPGGTENLEFKRPLDHAALKVSATFDSTGTRLLDADVNAPLTSWASGRLVNQLEDSDTFRDFERNERVAVYPMLKLTPTDDLTINLIGGYDRYLYTLLRYFYDYPGQFTIGEIESLPVSRSLQEPGQPLSRLDTYLYRAEADQKLGSEWSVGVAYFYNKSITKAYNELYAQKVADTDFQRSSMWPAILKIIIRAMKTSTCICGATQPSWV